MIESTRHRAARAGSAAVPRGSSLLTALFACALIVAVSRGLLETVLNKTAAYGVQVGFILLFLVALLLHGGVTKRPKMRHVAVAAYVFLIAVLVSMFLSLNINGIDYAGAYALVSLFYVGLLALFAYVKFPAHLIAVAPVVATASVLLVVVALAQQFGGLTLLPGNDRGTFGDFVRPASTTGSFLHYPLVAALLGFALLGIGWQRRRLRYTLLGWVTLGAVALSLSRSGLVILFIGVALGVLLQKDLGAKLRLSALVVLAGLAALVLLPSDRLVNRVLSLAQFSGGGNTNRFNAWTGVLDLWFQSPLVFGAHMGQYTNVTANFSATDSTVAESGVLQILVSFGIVGLIGFYVVMFGTVGALPRTPAWFRAGALAAIVQSAFYQSIEVLPFMVVFALYPLIAGGVEGRLRRAGEAVADDENDQPASDSAQSQRSGAGRSLSAT